MRNSVFIPDLWIRHPKTAFGVWVLPFLVTLLLFSTNVLHAQAQNGTVSTTSNVGVSVSINSSESAVELTTVTNMNLGQITQNQVEVFVDPLTDPGAGLMRATGRPNASVRISFQASRELIRVGGGAILNFTYMISGNTIEEQTTAELLREENRDIRLGPSGEYFFWIGGRMNLEGVVFGQYEGEFTIEIDYL